MRLIARLHDHKVLITIEEDAGENGDESTGRTSPGVVELMNGPKID